MSDTVSFKKGLSENITTAEVSPGQILVATDNGQVRVDYSNKTDNTSSSVFVSDPSKVASMTFNTSTRKLTYVKGDGTSTDVSIPTGDTDVKVTNTLSNTTKAYVTGTSNASTNTGTQYFDSGVYLENTAGNFHADGTINGLVPYASCSTAAATAAKAVTVNGTYTLKTGARVIVKFTNTNSAANPTLNVNSTGAKAIYYKGDAITADYLVANKTYMFIFNGTQYDLVGDVDTNTTYTSLKNPYSLILKANGNTLTNGSYDGSAEKTVDLSPANIGAATSGHTHAIDGSTITGTLPVSKGGTGATTELEALANLGAAKIGHAHTTVNGHTVESDVPSGAVFTDTKVTNTLGTTTKAYVTGTSSASTNTGTQVFDTGVYLENTAGNLHADGTINGAIPYGSCSTAAGTAAKTVTVNGTYSLVTGARVVVKFTVTNTAGSPTLNVNSTGAKAIYYRGAAISAGYLAANRTYQFIYNGTQYELIGDLDTNSDTKVTSAANHYTPATNSNADKTASASGATAAWSIDVVKGVTLNTDGKGHVTGLSVTSGKIPANPNTDTHYTTHVYAGSGSAANATTTNGNTKLTIADNTTVPSSNGYVTIKGAGATTVTSDANGVITINSTDNNTDTKVTAVGNHYTPTADTNAAISVDASSSTAATWNSTSLVTGVNLQRDAKGHVTGMTVDSIKMPANPNTNTTYSAGNGMTLSGTTFNVGKRWNAVTQGQKWSRLYLATPVVATEGSSGLLSVSCTRGSVVANATFLITSSHASRCQIIELAATQYTAFRCRAVVQSAGTYYFEIYDTGNGIASGTAQTWHCCFIPLLDTTLTTYTAFTDGSTIPDGYTAVNDFTITTGSEGAAIKNITRNGTTFTATRTDGTTFTFTQQDNDTWTAFKGATSTAAGTAGYVSPAPAANDLNSVFRSNGTWADQSTMLNTLTEGSSASQRADFIISQYAGGGTATTTYHRRSLANVFKALNSSDITTALGYTPSDTGHTHPISITADSGTNQLTLAASTKYKLTAGGNSYIFTTPPNTNTDTHWTTHLYAGSGDSAANAATTNGNTKIFVTDNNTVRDTKLTIKGTGATTVTSDANGVITINSTNTDTDTHYTTHLYAGSGTAANAATTNGNTKLTVVDNTTVRDNITVKGAGSVAVTSDANGVITITGTDTDTHKTAKIYAGSGSATNAATTNGNTKLTVNDNGTNTSLTIKGTGATTVSSDANGVITINSTDTNTNTDTIPSAYCDTAAATKDKVASCTNYAIQGNTYTHVLITVANTAQDALTLNINNRGAKPIYINGAASSSSNYTLPAGTYLVYFDGTNYYFRTDGVLAKTSYTPAGSVTVTPSVTAPTTTVNSITAVGTLPSCTMPTYSVDDEILTITAGSFSAGTLPTKGADTTVVKSVSATATGSFSGTAATISVKGN